MPDEKKAEKPGVIAYELKDEVPSKPGEEAKSKQPDVDDIRAQMAAGASFLGRVFKADKGSDHGGKAKEEKAKEEKAGEEKPKGEAGAGDGAAQTTEEAAAQPEFSDDDRAAAVLSVKPTKKAKTKEPPRAEAPMSVKEATEVAARAAAEAVRDVVAPTAKKEEIPAKKEEVEPEAYPDEYRDKAQIFDYLALSKPEKYKDLRTKLIAFDKKQADYISKWEEENSATFDPEDDAHAEFFDKNFPDIDSADIEAAKEAIDDARITLKAKKVAEKEMEPIKHRLEQERIHQAMAQVAPEIEAHEKSLIKEVFDLVAPDLGKWDPSQEKLAAVVAENEVEAEFVNAVVTPAADKLETYYRWLAGAEGYDERHPVHKALANTLMRLEKFIESRPSEEITRDGRTFATWEKINRLKPEDQQKFWGIGPNEVYQWIRSETLDQAKRGWEKRAKALDKYIQRKSGGVAASSASQGNAGGGSARKVLTANIVNAGEDGVGRGGIGLGNEPKSEQSGVGFSAFMRGLGFGKTAK